MIRKEVVLTLAMLLLLSACTATQEAAPAATEPAATAMAEESAMVDSGDSDQMASEELASEEMAAAGEAASDHPDGAMDGDMAEKSEEMTEGMDEPAMNADLPAWQTLPLTNARTGESFTLADFAGKTIFVEPMATWCTNCRRQLGNVKDAHAQLAGEDVVFVALSLETNIDDGTLANYANEAGFDWLFAVLTPEMLQELANEFGQTIANPPATPHFVIRTDGTTTDLVTGIEPADQIIAQIQAAQG